MVDACHFKVIPKGLICYCEIQGITKKDFIAKTCETDVCIVRNLIDCAAHGFRVHLYQERVEVMGNYH